MQKWNKFENIYQDVVCKIEAILLQQQCVSTLRPRNMAAVLQTIVWKQYFIHIAPKFGNWFGNVLCQMETTKNCPQYVNTVSPRQCDRHFTDNVFKLIQIAPNCIQTAPRFKIKFGSTLFQIEST